MRLRSLEPTDHGDALALNEEFVELLAPMPQQRLDLLLELSDRALVIDHDGFAGFVITLRAGTPYDSVNYRWFAERYDDFYYLDRVVLSPRVRRLGFGSKLYDTLEARAKEIAPRMCLEVNAEPPNVASLAFHRGRGFREVAQLGESGKLNSLQMLEF